MTATKRRQSQYRQKKTARKFTDKFQDSIFGTLSCFDRVILKGYLPFGDSAYLNRFIDYRLDVRRKDFYEKLEGMSQQLVDHAKQAAEQAGAPYHYFQGAHSKEQTIENIDRERQHPDGLIAVICVQEVCRSVRLRYGEGKPRVEFDRRQQRVVYWYFNDPDFGRIHIRQETWFPFTCQVYVNGHEWLAHQMLKEGLGFTQVDNAFTHIDDLPRAQRLAHRFRSIGWVNRLNHWVRKVNPLLKHRWFSGLRYRWYIDQAEYSTDVMFRSPETLREWYPRLLDHAVLNFPAQDILTFLGRRLHGNFEGEVLTTCRKDRSPGARVKHRVKNNWLKMYDKGGQLLRIETVINQPREFKVRRYRKRDGKYQQVWCPMNKGIANLYQYQTSAHSANLRYLEALAVVDNPSKSYEHTEKLARPCVVEQRSYAGFNPARREDVRLFEAVMRGEHLLHGFRNAEIRRILFGESSDEKERHRQATMVGRLVKRLHVRGLVSKVPRTRRWLVSGAGQKVLSTCIELYHHGLSAAA